MKLGHMQASYPTGTNSIERADRYSWNNRIPKMYILPLEIHRAVSATAARAVNHSYQERKWKMLVLLPSTNNSK